METPTNLQLSDIDTDADVRQLVAGFVPTPRFQHVTFDHYRPDPRFPSQRDAVQRVREFVDEIRAQADRPLLARLFGRAQRQAAPGLYLDGGFGVGKTHLLAAAYHASPGPKIYLSFAELAHWLGASGLDTCVKALASFRLICIDEFELDDIANTRTAAMFLDHLLNGPKPHPRIITTSNTLPSQLGQGRFEAEYFKQEIGRIAAAFEVIQICGEDYRRRGQLIPAGRKGWSSGQLRQAWEVYQPTGKAKSYATFSELLAVLRSLHPIRYGRLLAPLESLFIEGLAPIDDQADALRFVHLVDKAYDQKVRLFLSAECDLPGVFPSSYRNGGYRKKYERCLSRLGELLAESGEAWRYQSDSEDLQLA